jgi:hypothetical protein
MIRVQRNGAVAARRAHNPKVAGSSPAPASSFLRPSLLLVDGLCPPEMAGFFS